MAARKSTLDQQKKTDTAVIAIIKSDDDPSVNPVLKLPGFSGLCETGHRHAY